MNAVKITKKDNVAVALGAVKSASAAEYAGGSVRALCDIPAGHKIALCDIKAGEPVYKYGFKIGVATQDIAVGEWVHTHNVRSDLTRKNNESAKGNDACAIKLSDNKFSGFRRADGRVGVRNDLLIVPTVVCAVHSAERIAKAFLSENKGISVKIASHPYGCSQLGEDAESTAKVLASLAFNPNFGAVLVVSLGCENNNLSVMKPLFKGYEKSRIEFLNLQEAGDETEAGKKLLGKLAAEMKKDERVGCDISDLCIGIKCGGSDGMSGITANPLVGLVSDTVAVGGGKVIMTEIPETFGAEQTLFGRCENEELRVKLDKTIADFKEYYVRHGEKIGENPSPGNKEGGITTNEEKSLGCVLKSGNTAIRDVIGYGERVKKNGVTVLNAPGNDAVSLSALAAAGATVALFTTGRGTPIGSLIPVIKISTNRALAEKKSGWIDYDGSTAVSDGFEKAAVGLVGKILETANGKETKSETGGHNEFSIWKNGVTL